MKRDQTRQLDAMRREAAVIVPLYPPGGPLLNLERRLGDTFGGFTVIEGRGMWQGQAEDVAIYTVAMLDTGWATSMLLQITLEHGRAANQQAVYVRWPAGNVSILGNPDYVAPVEAEPPVDYTAPEPGEPVEQIAALTPGGGYR